MFAPIQGFFSTQTLASCCLALGLWTGTANAAILDHQNLPDVLNWLTSYQPEAADGNGKRLNFANLINSLEANKIIFVGETHDRYDHHLNQLAILRAMHERDPNLAIGVEWFQEPFQPIVDAWLAGKIDEDELLQRTGYFDRWRYDYRMLRPIMEYAKSNHLPVLALNAPTELTRKISHGGLQALTDAQRKQLPADISPPDNAYRSRLEKIFAEHYSEQHQLENFLLVQRVWDETMAENISRFLQPNPQWRMVVFSGSGHTSHGSGIPQDVAQHLPNIKQAIVTSSAAQEVKPGEADYFVLTHPFSLPATGKLGVKLAQNGVKIDSMVANSAAQRAGLQNGDRLAGINGTTIAHASDLMLMLARCKPGQQVQVSVERPGVAGLRAYNVVLQ